MAKPSTSFHCYRLYKRKTLISKLRILLAITILCGILGPVCGAAVPGPLRLSLSDTEAQDNFTPNGEGQALDYVDTKRNWQSLQGGWGKRAWQQLQSGWGKRAWQQLQGGWGKRKWQQMQGDWGKRAWDPTIVDTDHRADDSTNSERWVPVSINSGERSDPMVKYTLMFLTNEGTLKRLAANQQQGESDDSSDMKAGDDLLTSLEDPKTVEDGSNCILNDKRSWRSMNMGWGKRRNAPAWNKFRGAWGKREPGWNNLKGMWGKRSSQDWQKLHGGWGKRAEFN